MGEEIEVEASAMVQRRKSIEAVVKQTEAERERRLNPKTAEVKGFLYSAFVALSAIALGGLVLLTFEDKLFPAPPPPPPPSFFGLF